MQVFGRGRAPEGSAARRCCEPSGARGPLPGAPEASLGRGAVLPSRPAGQVGWGSTMGQPAAPRPGSPRNKVPGPAPQTGTRDAAQRSPARVGTPKQGPGSRAALIVSGSPSKRVWHPKYRPLSRRCLFPVHLSACPCPNRAAAGRNAFRGGRTPSPPTRGAFARAGQPLLIHTGRG